MTKYATKENCLATLRSDLIHQWDTSLNSLTPKDVTVGSSVKIWWKCNDGHSWKATPKSRISRKTGCPICARKLMYRSVTLKDGEICDSIVEAFFYLKYKSEGLDFIHGGRYGRKMGAKTYDFYFPSSKKYVEVTAYNKNWGKWFRYLRNIVIKRRHVKSIGGVFEFNIVKMTRDQIGFVNKNLADEHFNKYRDFSSARDFAKSLQLKSAKEWDINFRLGLCPKDIPRFPFRVYRGLGWSGYGDWLGTNRLGSQGRNFRTFQEARKFVRTLCLKDQKEWARWCVSGDRPDDMPTDPRMVYKDSGWLGFGDWLGTDRIANQDKCFRDFESSRIFVRSLGLKSEKDWRIYSKSSEKPYDIPSTPAKAYKNKGWMGFGDWLGTGSIATRHMKSPTFTEARAIVMKLGFRSWKEWSIYLKSQGRFRNIPSHPERVYKNKGWISWNDWFGK